MSKRDKIFILPAILIIAILLAAALPGAVWANAGPPYEPPEGALGGFTFEHSEYIKVLREDLLFEIKNGTWEDNFTAAITAAYTMQNLSDRPEKVKMAFPFLVSGFDYYTGGEGGNGSLGKEINITAGDKELPHTLRLLGSYSSIKGNYDEQMSREYVDKMLAGLNQSKTLNIDESKSYTAVEVTPTAGSTKIELAGIEGFVYVGATVYAGRYTDNERAIETAANSSFVIITESGQGAPAVMSGGYISGTAAIDDIKEFMINIIQKYFEENSGPDNIVTLDRQLAGDVYTQAFSASARGFFYEPDDFIYAFNNAVMGIFYEVDFGAGETLEMSVKYGANPYKLSERGRYTHNYVYFLSPASYWKGFGNLTVTVDVSGTDYKYILDSTADFTYDEKAQKYVYTSASLPDGELIFKMYSDSRLPIQHLNYVSLLLPFLLIPLGTYLVVSVVIIVIVSCINAANRKKRREIEERLRNQ